MCSDQQHKEQMDALARIEKLLMPRLPNDLLIQIDDVQGWQMDYKGYNHAFIFNPSPTTINLNLGDYGVMPLQGQIWLNLGVRTGIKIFTQGQSSPQPFILRFTNEVIP